MASQSVSISCGSIGAIASTMRLSSCAPVAPCTRPRTTRSKTIRSTRSPARDARAASSRLDSNAVSMRGSSATRAAEVRPESTMITTRRSRSGRQVRTTRVAPPLAGSRLRAVARQSIERTSSPRTYSRRLSNSVPGPRTITLVCPSSSRSRASRDGRCLRELKGGSTRIAPGTRMLACRAASRSGPNERTVTCAARRSPRRTGVSVTRNARRSPGGSATGRRVGRATADGCHASRSTPSTLRRPVFVTSSELSTVSPSRTRPGVVRSKRSARGEPAMHQVDGGQQRDDAEPAEQSPASPRTRRPAPRPRAPARRTSQTAPSPPRLVQLLRSAPAPAAGSSAGRRRSRRPRARPPAAAGCGGGAPEAPWSARGRA